MKLTEYIDVKKLRQHINVGLVTERFHDTLPLAIYCYGRKAVFDNHWDDVTTRTRGIIVDINTNDIVARPYEKFFSVEQKPQLLEEAALEEQSGNQPVITEKVNGCLGTFWRYGIHWGVASKGSFHSPHAEFATNWLAKHIEEHGALVFPEGCTPVFEIICQEVQPHVIKYLQDRLVLLSFINNATGEELSREATINYADTNRLDRTFLADCNLQGALVKDSDSFEGYVATYNRPGQSPLKLKIKFPTFLKNRKEFYSEQRLKDKPQDTNKYAEIFTEASTMLKEALAFCTTRKEFAEFFQKSNPGLSPVCFAMMDERDHKKVIWRIVERQRDNQAEATKG
jgi:tRNA splicing ligase